MEQAIRQKPTASLLRQRRPQEQKAKFSPTLSISSSGRSGPGREVLAYITCNPIVAAIYGTKLFSGYASYITFGGPRSAVYLVDQGSGAFKLTQCDLTVLTSSSP